MICTTMGDTCIQCMKPNKLNTQKGTLKSVSFFAPPGIARSQEAGTGILGWKESRKALFCYWKEKEKVMKTKRLTAILLPEVRAAPGGVSRPGRCDGLAIFLLTIVYT